MLILLPENKSKTPSGSCAHKIITKCCSAVMKMWGFAVYTTLVQPKFLTLALMKISGSRRSSLYTNIFEILLYTLEHMAEQGILENFYFTAPSAMWTKLSVSRTSDQRQLNAHALINEFLYRFSFSFLFSSHFSSFISQLPFFAVESEKATKTIWWTMHHSSSISPFQSSISALSIAKVHRVHMNYSFLTNETCSTSTLFATWCMLRLL